MSLLEEGRLKKDLSDMVSSAGGNEHNCWCWDPGNVSNVREVIVLDSLRQHTETY